MSLKNLIRSLKRMSPKRKKKSKKGKRSHKRSNKRRSSPKLNYKMYDGIINVDTNYIPFAYGCRVPKSFT